MLKTSKFDLLATFGFIVVAMTGCNRSNSSSTSGGGSGGTSRPSGHLLFQTQRTPTELSTLKTEFLQVTPIEKLNGVERYNINTVRGPSCQPISPIVHTYHGPSALVPLAVSLPEIFRWNIPQEMREQISQYNVDDLDILFTPQEEIREVDASLKPAYWMFPGRPKLDDIHGAPPEYQNTVLLGLFDSDHPIDDQVRSGHLIPFGVSLHDGRVSPDTGHINMAAAPHESFTFYSLAIFEEQRRAAVTLHWMLTHADKETFVGMLQAKMMSGDNHFDSLMEAMNDPTSPFYGTSMMRKLIELTNP